MYTVLTGGRDELHDPEVTLPGVDFVCFTFAPVASSAWRQVAIEAGFTYPQNAAVTMQVDQAGLDFYTSQRNAFARDGKAVVGAFEKGNRAIARSPGPNGQQVTDTFSLKGFSAAYQAITKACPAK